MNIAIISILILLSATIITAVSILMYKLEQKNKTESIDCIKKILTDKNFNYINIKYVSKNLTLAVNKTYTRLLAINNFNYRFPNIFNKTEIIIDLIEKIEKNISIKIFYRDKGILKKLEIYPVDEKLKDFIHEAYKESCIRKLEKKFPEQKFELISTSDWECSYLWAYSPKDKLFAYYKTGNSPCLRKYNIEKKFFTIDTKYKYFEASVQSIPQQLFVYEEEFLDNLRLELLKEIRRKYNCVVKDNIYFDSYNKIIYLSNGINSLQSILIDKIEEIYYKDTRLAFSVKDSNRVINFFSNHQLVKEFEEFIINYNLQHLAKNLDYKLDKIINTTQYTKCIIDFSKERIVYCANLNKIRGFNFLIILFNNLQNTRIEKYGQKNFVRISTKEYEIIDITCDKKEIAQYINAQIKTILS